MTHGPTTDEVEQIVALQLDGEDDKAKEILHEIGHRYEEDVRLNQAEYIGKIRDLDRRWQQRYERATILVGGMGGLVAAYWVYQGYRYMTGDNDGVILLIVISFLCVVMGSLVGRQVARG